MYYTHCPVDPLDHERSVFRYFPNRPNVILEVVKFEFQPQLIPDYELFRTPQFDWIFKGTLVNKLAEQNFVGLAFDEIWDDGQ